MNARASPVYSLSTPSEKLSTIIEIGGEPDGRI